MPSFNLVEAPIGCVGFVASGAKVSHIYLFKQPPPAAIDILRRRHPDCPWDPALLADFRRELDLYFSGRRVCFSVVVDLSPLTAFRRRVLRACSRIAYGETVSYGELARRVGCPAGARAVGGAMACNPVPLVVPCHRVVAGNGSLGGFSAEQGVSLKRYLLDLESRGRAGPVAG